MVILMMVVSVTAQPIIDPPPPPPPRPVPRGVPPPPHAVPEDERRTWTPHQSFEYYSWLEEWRAKSNCRQQENEAAKASESVADADQS